MKKILIVITTSFVPFGGLTTVVMNYYRALDKKGLKIDFASTNEAPTSLKKELEENGSKYYCLGRRRNIFSYINRLDKLLVNYDVIHVHGNSATMYLELFPAKKRHVQMRIAHVHTTQTQHPLINKIIYPIFRKSYNKAIAVSVDSGEWLFKKNYTILNNAIDVRRYSFSEERRTITRNNLGISLDCFVVGNVGKINAPKNQKYLLGVLKQLKKRINNCKLLIVGGGELEYELRKMSTTYGIEKDVIFTGMVDDASNYLQAFDFFAFPSIFEGLGLALIEAQASGLKCIISDKVPNEAIVSDLVKVAQIDNNFNEWSNYIANNQHYDRKSNSLRAIESIKEHGYYIKNEANKLKEIYMAEVK